MSDSVPFAMPREPPCNLYLPISSCFSCMSSLYIQLPPPRKPSVPIKSEFCRSDFEQLLWVTAIFHFTKKTLSCIYYHFRRRKSIVFRKQVAPALSFPAVASKKYQIAKASKDVCGISFFFPRG